MREKAKYFHLKKFFLTVVTVMFLMPALVIGGSLTGK